jgi:hypothetical protein
LSFTGHATATDLNPTWTTYSQASGASEAGIVGHSGTSLYGRRALTTEERPTKPLRQTITATWGKEIRQTTLTINP